MQTPELDVSEWFNTDTPLTLGGLRGRVVVIEAFQMLCPGCVLHGIPLVQSIQKTFPEEKVAVIGLHTVFEHHDAMTPVSLKAFLHEYRITFPVGVDRQGVGQLPNTMSRFGMRGTPSLVLLDQSGRIVVHHLGQVSELQLGSEIGSLLTRGAASVTSNPATVNQNEGASGSCNV